MDIQEEIAQIKHEIQSFNNKIGINNEHTVSQEKEKEKEKVKDVSSKGNTYALEQFKFQQSYLNYKRNQNKKKDDVQVINNTDELMKMIDENDYKKPWIKLDNYQKKKKIKEYVSDLEISEVEKNTKLEKYNSLLKDKTFNKSVNYIIEQKKISSIKDT